MGLARDERQSIKFTFDANATKSRVLLYMDKDGARERKVKTRRIARIAVLLERQNQVSGTRARAGRRARPAAERLAYNYKLMSSLAKNVLRLT